ncbi:hypothetical protein [Streptomyces xinghaiensis]|uniref:hypothetical protein n=1 Tax=Streptomyces xinghaiensis TaxID=1038928 RepID=UPI000592BBAA|nr:hypothetical protein [Streptomyces xinghaiensis]MZE76245.1 hypothetical protein [Streptomyces sp. SID5475]
MARLLITDFRGWKSLDLRPRDHAVVAGVPRAGRSDVIEALARVLDPEAAHGSSLSDLHQTAPVEGEGEDQTLPAAAEAAMRRDFTHDAIRTATTAGRILVTDYADGHSHAEVIDLTRRARKDGETVGIFTHTNVAASSLSDALLADGLVHEQAGLTEAQVRPALRNSPW